MAKKEKPYLVHFVCRGNVYRSRLAAAYFKTLTDSRFSITSSGVATGDTDLQTIAPVAQAAARFHGLGYDLARRKRQTTNELLAKADIVVFLHKNVYDEALKKFDFDARKCLVWHVPDFTHERMNRLVALRSEQALTDATADAFRRIQRLCNELHAYLTHTAWVDVVDAANKPIGLRLPMAWVTDRGLWHRGIHVVAQTADGKYVVEKRASKIVFSPGMLDISLGGGVDSGEHPLQAAVRETHEELGIHVPGTHFRPLFMYRKVGYHPHYKKETKGHVYVYAVRLPVHSNALRPQREEVAEILTLSRRQIMRLMRKHRLRHIGQLSWAYKLYSKAIAYSSLPL